MQRAPETLMMLALVGLLGACGAQDGQTDMVADEGSPEGAANVGQIDPIAELPPPTDHTIVDGQRESAGSVDLAPTPDELSRNLRRMSVPQLKDAIRNATGGVYWHDGRGNDMLDLLAPTLGVPNYLDITSEDLEAALVFQKFLGDGVRSVCAESIQNDLDMSAEDRVMIRFVDPDVAWDGADDAQKAAIDRNLAYMRLRITGHHSDNPEDPEMVRLRWLWRSVTHATGEPSRGWRAVCVGLMSSPEFFLY